MSAIAQAPCAKGREQERIGEGDGRWGRHEKEGGVKKKSKIDNNKSASKGRRKRKTQERDEERGMSFPRSLSLTPLPLSHDHAELAILVTRRVRWRKIGGDEGARRPLGNKGRQGEERKEINAFPLPSNEERREERD